MQRERGMGGRDTVWRRSKLSKRRLHVPERRERLQRHLRQRAVGHEQLRQVRDGVLCPRDRVHERAVHLLLHVCDVHRRVRRRLLFRDHRGYMRLDRQRNHRLLPSM